MTRTGTYQNAFLFVLLNYHTVINSRENVFLFLFLTVKYIFVHSNLSNIHFLYSIIFFEKQKIH